jgi:hypothetical protein
MISVSGADLALLSPPDHARRARQRVRLPPRPEYGACGALVVLLLGALTLSACGPTVDLTTGVQVLNVSTGWKDVGVQADGKNKLVPTLSFKLKNLSDQPLRTLRVNAVFKQVGTDEEFGAEYVVVTQSDALEPAPRPGLSEKPLKGYTGTEAVPTC